MRIVAGDLRGDIRVTSSRLKESLFAMLGPLEGRNFFDLCAGCGQIGLEAHSRGSKVTMNEPHRKRSKLLKDLDRERRLRGVELLSAKAEVLIPRRVEKGRGFDTIYLDPPYRAKLRGSSLYHALVDRLNDGALLNPGGLLAVQHNRDTEISRGDLEVVRQRRYGDNLLSIFVAPNGS